MKTNLVSRRTWFVQPASCDTWGALYSWETAMMADRTWRVDERNAVTWEEPAYGTESKTGNMSNAGKGPGKHGICPQGWHVPTDAEWGEVFNELETGTRNHNTGYSFNGATAGHRAKARRSCPHTHGNICVNDRKVAWFDLVLSAGFPAAPGLQLIPAGFRSFDGHSLEDRGLKATLWSSSAYSRDTAWYRRVSHDSGYVYRFTVSRSYGASVRCIKN